MIKPYYENNSGCLYSGDCLEILQNIPDNIIDMVFTDPPFMISQEIKICRQRNPKKYNTKRWKYQGKDIDLDFGQWDKFQNLEEYLAFTNNWLKECARVCRQGAHLIIFFDKYKISYLIEIAQKYNLKPRQPLFWLKTNPTPQARKVKFMTSLEMMMWFTKETNSRKSAIFNYSLGQHSEVFISPICQGYERYMFGRHPTQKPLKILMPVLEYLTNKNDVILDWRKWKFRCGLSKVE
jgi:DNA modification methylase